MSFDPYHRWLGIPPEEQPAHHYRLLGIKPFEDQPEVIESAADRQMVHLRNHQAGEHSDLSQKLLNEVAAARVCLLNPGKKAEYDRALRGRLEAAGSGDPRRTAGAGVGAGPAGVGAGLPTEPLGGPQVSEGRGDLRSESRRGQETRAERDGVGAGLPTEPLDPGLAQLFDKTAHAPAHGPAATSARVPQAARRAKQAQLWASIGIVAVGIVVVAFILIRAGGSRDHADLSGGKAAPVHPEDQKPRKPQLPPKVQPTDVKPPAASPPRTTESGAPDAVQPPPQIAGDAPATSQSPAVEKPQRLPVPAQAERDKAIAELNEVYTLSKERTPAEKHQLAADLLEVAEKARQRPAERYVLLDAAMRLEGQEGDAARMLELAGRVAAEFQIDPLAAKAGALRDFAGAAKDTARIRALSEATEELIDAALARDDYGLAQDLADQAYAACQVTAGRDFRKRAFDRRNRVQALTVAWQEVQAALDKLKTEPDDPEANLTAARYFCFVKGDWDQGLPHLAKGTDGAVQELAAQELKSPPADVDGMMKLADAWWDLADAAKGQERDAMRLRAGAWYEEASGSLGSALLKAKAERRMAEVAALGRKLPRLPARRPAPAVAPFDEKTARSHQERWAKHLGVPVVRTNSLGMKLALVPPGEFDMGSTEKQVAQLLEDDKQQGTCEWYAVRLPTETPRHHVKITGPFYLAVCEVTQGEYEQVMGTNPSQSQGDPNRPVEMTSWDDAVEFCRKLGELPKEKAAGAVYRLPAEAQWEYACQAGAAAQFGFGDDESLLEQYAWWSKNSQNRTQPVGRLKPNAWGLYDMHGNVWEWCSDRFGEGYYAKSPVDDPAGPASGTDRACRGSSFHAPARACRAAYRHQSPPETRFYSVGFRVLLVVADK